MPDSPPPEPLPATAPISATTGRTRERGLKPELFDGDKSKSELFLLSVKNYFALNAHIYSSDAERVQLFLSFFKHGTNAGVWARNWLRELVPDSDSEDESVSGDPDDDEEELDPPAPTPVVTLKVLYRDFKKTFSTIDEEQVAQGKLETLTVTSGIDNYRLEFETLHRQSGLGPKAGLILFRKGLPPALVDRISGTFPQPKNFEEYKDRAITLQHQWEQRRAESA